MVRIPCWGRDEPAGDPALALLADALLATLGRLGPEADLRAHTAGVQAALAAAWASWAAAQRPPPQGLGSLGLQVAGTAQGSPAEAPAAPVGPPVLARGAFAAVAAGVAEALSWEERAGKAQEEPIVVDLCAGPAVAPVTMVEGTLGGTMGFDATASKHPGGRHLKCAEPLEVSSS